MKQSPRLPAVKQSVTTAREFATTAVGVIPEDVLDAVLVVTSELTSNCVRHGASSFQVKIEQFPDRIVIEVEDDADGEPVIRAPGPTDTSGRGLLITSALAEKWGVRRVVGSNHKTVWAEVLIPPSPMRQFAQEHGAQTVPAKNTAPDRMVEFAIRKPWVSQLVFLRASVLTSSLRSAPL
jgi:anti-sigma regulatory factor (Ser/Thr protein kinase)